MNFGALAVVFVDHEITFFKSLFRAVFSRVAEPTLALQSPEYTAARLALPSPFCSTQCTGAFGADQATRSRFCLSHIGLCSAATGLRQCLLGR